MKNELLYLKSVLLMGLLNVLISVHALGQTKGEFHKGGYVFHLDDKGGGIVAAPSNAGIATLGCASYRATHTALGWGQENSKAIIRECRGQRNAAKICDDLQSGGFSDWYLPSRDELQRMIWSLYPDKLPSPGIAHHYATSSISGNYLRTVDMIGGRFSHAGIVIKTEEGEQQGFIVRCVRNF